MHQLSITFVALSLLFITMVRCSSVLQFEIYKELANNQHQGNKIYLGTLQVVRNFEYQQVEASIKPNFPGLVSEQDLKQSPVILSFVPKKLSDIKSQNSVYRTSVIEKLPGPQDEIIGVIIGVDLHIKAINYLEKRSPLQQIKTQVFDMKPGKEQIAKIQMLNKKAGGQNAPEDESFFSKYKWPIIIGIVLMFVTSQGGQDQGTQGGQQRK